MPLGHISLPTGQKNFETMKAFYAAALAPLGYSIFMEHAGVIGFKQPRAGPEFWLHCGQTEFEVFDGNMEKRGGRPHVAFQAKSEAEVRKWYDAAIKAGGIDNGKPGERPHYVKGYYGAFIIDPLGNNIEAMHWSPVWLKAAQSVPYVMTAVFGAALAYGASLVQSGALDGIVARFTK